MLLSRTSDGFQYLFDRPVRLLAVDDDPILREFAVAQFSQPGATILTAQDGDEAWDILTSDPEGFDLVLSDLEMPRCNGFMLVERIRASARHAHIPVVVITGRDDLFAIDRAYEVGATTFVTKPVNWRQLGYQLRYVLRTAAMDLEIRQARDTAQRAAALRENLLALLQHVTRTPLNAILGYGQLVRRELDDGSTRIHVDAMLHAAADLGETLSRVFRYAQLAAGTISFDFESAPVDEAITAAISASRAKAHEKRVEIIFEPAAASRPALVDLRNLSVAVKEIIANAIAASPEGGQVTIETREGEDESITIRICDEGPGFGDQPAERLIQPFRADRDVAALDGVNLGLGLPTVAAITLRHGGRVDIESGRTGGAVSIVLGAANAKLLDTAA
jgi:signal transduction histidine kinase